VKTTPKRNDAQRKAESLAQTKPRNTKEKPTLKSENDTEEKTTLKEKQIHSQENDTQSRLKHASRQKNLL